MPVSALGHDVLNQLEDVYAIGTGGLVVNLHLLCLDVIVQPDPYFQRAIKRLWRGVFFEKRLPARPRQREGPAGIARLPVELSLLRRGVGDLERLVGLGAIHG